MYTLDPKLQEGKKSPRWQPRSITEVFGGLSNQHFSDIPFMLNLQTGSISPQFHVVFDDNFSRVKSIADNEDPPSFWNELQLGEFTIYIHNEAEASQTLNNEWLTHIEVEEKQRIQSRSDIIRSYFRQPQESITDPVLITNTISPKDLVVITDTILAQDTASSSLKNNYLVLPSSSDISPVALLPFQHLPESSASLPGIANTYSNTSSLKRSSCPTKANISSTRRNTRSTKGA